MGPRCGAGAYCSLNVNLLPQLPVQLNASEIDRHRAIHRVPDKTASVKSTKLLTISSSDTGPILRMRMFVITSSGRTAHKTHNAVQTWANSLVPRCTDVYSLSLIVSYSIFVQKWIGFMKLKRMLLGVLALVKRRRQNVYTVLPLCCLSVDPDVFCRVQTIIPKRSHSDLWLVGRSWSLLGNHMYEIADAPIVDNLRRPKRSYLYNITKRRLS